MGTFLLHPLPPPSQGGAVSSRVKADQRARSHDTGGRNSNSGAFTFQQPNLLFSTPIISGSFFLFFFFFFKRLKKCGTEDSNVEEGEKYGQERGKCDSWAGSLFLFLFSGGVLPPGSGD